MFVLGALAVIAFVCYFVVVGGVLPLMPFMSLARFALDAGLLLALLTIIAAGLAARKHRANRSQVSLYAIIGLIVLAISALAVYATRYI